MPAAREGDISPPPVKRRRLSPTAKSTSPTAAQEDDLDVLRIYSWNVNGIGPFVQPAITSFFRSSKAEEAATAKTATGSLRDVLRRYDWPTMMLLQEVKINPEDRSTRRAVERSLLANKSMSASTVASPNDKEPDYEAHFCLPRDRYNARGFGRKVYGVCTIIRSDFAQEYVERVREVDWDLEGRILICETRRVKVGGPRLAIINVYAVNGTDLPYRDSQTGEIAGTRHDRKLKVHQLLQAECHALEMQGFAVVLAGDLNIARHRKDGFPNLRTFPHQHCLNREDFERRFFGGAGDPTGENADDEDTRGLAMVDTFRELHPEQAGYTYYTRGVKFGASCDRVDMILLSQTLQTSLIAAGMHETPADRGPSDHVPLYAHLRIGAVPDESSS